MRRFLFFALVAVSLGEVGVAAQSTVYMIDTPSKIAGPVGWQIRTTATAPGASSTTAVAQPAAGDISTQSWVNCGTLCATQAAAGPPRIWLTPPLSATATVSGAITPTLYCGESASQLNAGWRVEILHWSKATGGFIASLGITSNNGSGECPTTVNAATSIPTIVPNDAWSCSTNCHGQTWNVFAAGDRIGVLWYPDDSTSGTLAQSGSRTTSLRYNGTAASYYATSVGFTETLSFSADFNNARPIGSTD